MKSCEKWSFSLSVQIIKQNNTSITIFPTIIYSSTVTGLCKSPASYWWPTASCCSSTQSCELLKQLFWQNLCMYPLIYPSIEHYWPSYCIDLPSEEAIECILFLVNYCAYQKPKIFSEKQKELRDGLSYSTPQKREETRGNAIIQPRSHPIKKM